MKLGCTEKQIHAAVIEHWLACGVKDSLVATIPNERAHGQAGLTKGLPDLLVMAPGLGVGFIELKRKGGKLRPEQERFRDLCNAIGVRYSATFGRDEPISILEAWGVVRAHKKEAA
jgi:hypothetical protein